jgi:hypothetical protein
LFGKFLDSKNWKGRKERRKKYYDSRAFDCTCRNHGTCEWCVENRTFFDKKQRDLADLQLDISEEELDMLVHKEKLQEAIDLERWEEDEFYYEEAYWRDAKGKFT